MRAKTLTVAGIMSGTSADGIDVAVSGDETTGAGDADSDADPAGDDGASRGRSSAPASERGIMRST